MIEVKSQDLVITDEFTAKEAIRKPSQGCAEKYWKLDQVRAASLI